MCGSLGEILLKGLNIIYIQYLHIYKENNIGNSMQAHVEDDEKLSMM